MICDYQLCLVSLCPGTRSNAEQTDLSEILPEDVEEQVKAAAEISMGTEVTFYFCGSDLSCDYRINKCSTKKIEDLSTSFISNCQFEPSQ